MPEVQWEAEFFTLQDNNNKLVAALQEANASVEQWKKQLAAYQEETETLRLRVSTRNGARRHPDLKSACGPHALGVSGRSAADEGFYLGVSGLRLLP